MVLMGPEGPDLVPTADDWLVWVELMITGGPKIDDIVSMVLYLIVLFGITWYCISFDCIACPFIVLYGIAWHGMVLYCI